MLEWDRDQAFATVKFILAEIEHYQARPRLFMLRDTTHMEFPDLAVPICSSTNM